MHRGASCAKMVENYQDARWPRSAQGVMPLKVIAVLMPFRPVPIITRQADQAAEWFASQAISAGGTLQGYTSVAGAGAQYAAYWTPQEVLQADAHRRAKQGGP